MCAKVILASEVEASDVIRNGSGILRENAKPVILLDIRDELIAVDLPKRQFPLETGLTSRADAEECGNG